MISSLIKLRRKKVGIIIKWMIMCLQCILKKDIRKLKALRIIKKSKRSEFKKDLLKIIIIISLVFNKEKQLFNFMVIENRNKEEIIIYNGINL